VLDLYELALELFIVPVIVECLGYINFILQLFMLYDHIDLLVVVFYLNTM